MKKALLLVLTAMLVLSTLVFSGCKKKVEEPAPEAVEEVVPPTIEDTLKAGVAQ